MELVSVPALSFRLGIGLLALVLVVVTVHTIRHWNDREILRDLVSQVQNLKDE